MSKPDYSTRDPKGWCGDPKRGAALGRHTYQNAPRDTADKFTLQRVRLGLGYDRLGTYWGHGAPLYWCANEAGTVDFCLRAGNREAAKALVRKDYPNARFYN